jgi:hypothetical protein
LGKKAPMTRDEFKAHISERVEASIQQCERHIGRKLPRKLAFQWISPKGPRVDVSIEEEICREVFVADDKIWPCVDIGPWQEEDGTLVIRAIRAGYPPAPFQKNWQGADGPFILVIGGGIEAWKKSPTRR